MLVFVEMPKDIYYIFRNGELLIDYSMVLMLRAVIDRCWLLMLLQCMQMAVENGTAQTTQRMRPVGGRIVMVDHLRQTSAHLMADFWYFRLRKEKSPGSF